MISRELRIAEVQAWQTRYGMTPRDDSRLTELYADDLLEWSSDEVARELVCTDFIHRETLYGQIIEDFMRQVCHRLRAKYRLSWTSAWKIVRFYAPTALKCMCIDACSTRLPDLSHFHDSEKK
jgi:hypothetical protein